MYRLLILTVLVGLSAVVAGARPSVEGGVVPTERTWRANVSTMVVEDLVGPVFAYNIALDIEAGKIYRTAPLNGKELSHNK